VAVNAPPTRYDHVVWIVMENHSFDQIIGASDAPYINQLAGEHGLAASFYAESHPSLPNYIAMTSGSTQAIADDDDPSAHALDVPSLGVEPLLGAAATTANLRTPFNL
jgi:phosphatidylinositol-3-phosphatase